MLSTHLIKSTCTSSLYYFAFIYSLFIYYCRCTLFIMIRLNNFMRLSLTRSSCFLPLNDTECKTAVVCQLCAVLNSIDSENAYCCLLMLIVYFQTSKQWNVFKCSLHVRSFFSKYQIHAQGYLIKMQVLWNYRIQIFINPTEENFKIFTTRNTGYFLIFLSLKFAEENSFELHRFF